MKIVSMPRRRGKTRYCVDILLLHKQKGEKAVIVCVNNEEADRVRKEYKLDDEDTVGVTQARNFLMGFRGHVIVDNADWILRNLIGPMPDMATFNLD